MNSGGLQLRTRTAKDILFTTNNTERMRIDNSGDVSIGRSAGNARLMYTGLSLQLLVIPIYSM